VAEIFISYSKHDRPQALELARELRAEDFSVWIDQGGIEGAQNWSAKIVEGINDCSTMLLLISPDSMASRNVAREVHIAFEKRKNILPVVIEKAALPANFEYSLAGLQRVHYHDRAAILQALRLLRSGVGVTEQLPQRDVPEPQDSSIRVAVLPFDDLSPLHDNQWFADGMMDELIGTLAQLDKVKVPSRSDVLHYRDHRVKSKDIANELGVRYLIEGAVRKAGERIRINATLIDTRHNEQLWGNQFNGTFDDVFTFQETVAKHVMEALKLQLTPKETESIEAHPTQNVKAYELYLKGRQEQYYNTKESYEKAIELYEQAISLDPQFVFAYIGVASICSTYYREYSKDSKWLKRAEASLSKAEKIGGETSRSLWVHGTIEWLRGNNEAAIAKLTRSTELDPKNQTAFNMLGILHIGNQNYPAAVEAFQHVVDIMESTIPYFNLLIALDYTKQTELRIQTAKKALPVFDRYLIREPQDDNAALSRAFVLLWAGMKEEAAQAASLLLKRDDLSGNILYNLGCLFENLGKPELFIALLRKAIDHGYRELEQTRNVDIANKTPEFKAEFNTILNELEELIEHEKNLSE
jgi:TolB-like protein/Tfp pilus assembly protein PilF